ncbi:Uncharacterized protein APZ42_027228 [Daphnia magna]|uniref:Uncharacterized protein n=1 Tax=Daphnia magna TaxID=35525 RepID=A0A164RDB5_9CRUS|nr:Uncharacterized protein APZ42_027228 [Daphnia magna]
MSVDEILEWIVQIHCSNSIVFHTILLVVGTSWNKLHLTFERYLHLGLRLKNIVAKCPSKAVMLSYQLKVNTGCPILASWKSVFPLMFQQGMNFDISLPSLGVSLVIFDQVCDGFTIHLFVPVDKCYKPPKFMNYSAEVSKTLHNDTFFFYCYCAEIKLAILQPNDEQQNDLWRN